MEVIHEVSALRTWNRENTLRRRALVPTMGALHRGHTSLLDIARKEVGEEGQVVATIFVNPTQFGPNEDLAAYPRTLESDLEKCNTHGADLVFVPDSRSIYEKDASIEIHELSLSQGLCGASRPGHFTGVCTVVAKLFNLTQADVAVFGEKDFQQLAIIRRMVRDLDFPIEIVAGPTVREKDGLALSSRNTYLSEEDRSSAPVIRKALREAGNARTFGEASQIARNLIETVNSAKIDYLEIVDPVSLKPVDPESGGTARIIAAVYFGKTRLIDNRQIDTSLS